MYPLCPVPCSGRGRVGVNKTYGPQIGHWRQRHPEHGWKECDGTAWKCYEIHIKPGTIALVLSCVHTLLVSSTLRGSLLTTVRATFYDEQRPCQQHLTRADGPWTRGRGEEGALEDCGGHGWLVWLYIHSIIITVMPIYVNATPPRTPPTHIYHQPTPGHTQPQNPNKYAKIMPSPLVHCPFVRLLLLALSSFIWIHLSN